MTLKRHTVYHKGTFHELELTLISLELRGTYTLNINAFLQYAQLKPQLSNFPQEYFRIVIM